MFFSIKNNCSILFKTALAVLLFFGTLNLVAQEVLTDEEVAKIKKKWERRERKKNRINTFKVFPALFFTPETSLAFGVSGVGHFKFVRKDSNMKYSKVLPMAIYTLNKQYFFLSLYELNYYKYLFKGEVGFTHYPYFYSGIGNEHPNDQFEKYTSDFFKFDADVYRMWVDNFYAGVKYWYQNTSTSDFEEGGELENGNVPGGGGSVLSGIGAGAIYDTRNFILSPTKGWYLNLGAVFMDQWTGSDFHDNVYLADLRTYIPIKKIHTLALQVYAELHFGEPPFNRMALLGGPNRMRGYVEGVYRDKKMLVVQAEYRSPIFLKYFAAAAFVSVGAVGEDFAVLNKYWRYTYGFGLRGTPLPKQRFFFRFDVGFGQNTNAFYFSLGEAF